MATANIHTRRVDDGVMIDRLDHARPWRQLDRERVRRTAISAGPDSTTYVAAVEFFGCPSRR